jgi:hypothetical protein
MDEAPEAIVGIATRLVTHHLIDRNMAVQERCHQVGQKCCRILGL